MTAGYGSLAEQKWNVYGMIDYQKFEALAARDREFSKSNYIPGAFNQTSSVSFPANVLVRINNNNNFRTLKQRRLDAGRYRIALCRVSQDI